MNKIAEILYGRIKAIYKTNMSFEDWKIAHTPTKLYIDVTDTDVKIGDDINLLPDGSYTVIPSHCWYERYDTNSQYVDINLLKKEKLTELEETCGKVFSTVFLHQAELSPKITMILENEAIKYLRDKSQSKILIDLAEATGVSIDEMVDQILSARQYITDTVDKIYKIHKEYKNKIETAQSVEDITNVNFKF